MTTPFPLLVCAVLLSYTISTTLGSGVLTIRLTGFKNTFGRTYDGTCCDPSPKDHGSTCYDECDYVMRLIVTGLGRANDHVFLFHRPLTYDSNNIVFENGDSNLLLTVLFDEWPEDDQVKMNAFFYDYDDFDHTTTLVDWFETDLRHSANSTSGVAAVWGNFQQQTVTGNRETDKTVLTFEWSALNEKDDYTHLTTDRTKVTVAPSAEPTHMTRLSTSKEATDFLRQAWTHAGVNDYTSIHFDEDLRTKVPGLLKSVLRSLRPRKEQLPKRIVQNEKPMTSNIHNEQYFKKSDAVGDKVKLDSKHDLIKSLNYNRYPRRRIDLMKRKPAISKMSKSQSFRGKLDVKNNVYAVERNSSMNEVLTTSSQNPKLLFPQRNQTLQPQGEASIDSDDRSTRLDKPGYFKNRRPFVRPHSWFNSFSDKLSPADLNERRKNYERKYERKQSKQWKKSGDQRGDNEKDMISQENTEDTYNDIYLDHLSMKDNNYVRKQFSRGKSTANSQIYKDKTLNTPGKVAQHRPKSVIHRIHYPGSQDLKVNLTEALASKVGDTLRGPKQRNSDTIPLDKSLIASRRKAAKARVLLAKRVYKNHASQQSFVNQPDFQMQISSDSVRDSAATATPPISSTRNHVASSLDLKTQSKRTDTELKSYKMTAANATNMGTDTSSKRPSPMLKRRKTPKPRASNRIVVYKPHASKNNNTLKDGNTADQSNKLNLKGDKLRNVDENINASPSFTDRPVNTHLIYPHQQESRSVYIKNNAKNISRKIKMWRKTTMAKPENSYVTLQATRNKEIPTVRSVKKLDVSAQPAERSRAAYASSSTTIDAHPSLQHRPRTTSHQSQTNAPKPEPYTHTKIYINAAAAIDRPRFSPSRKKDPQTVHNSAINESFGLLNKSFPIKQDVKLGRMQLKGAAHTTTVATWNTPKEIMAVGHSEAGHNVAATRDQRVSYKPQSAFINSNELSDAQIQNTDMMMHNGPTERGLIDTKSSVLRNINMIANKKSTSTNVADVDINNTFVQQINSDGRFAPSELKGTIKSTRTPQQNSGIEMTHIKSKIEVTSNDNNGDDKLRSAPSERRVDEAKQIDLVYNQINNGDDKLRSAPSERRVDEAKQIDLVYNQINYGNDSEQVSRAPNVEAQRLDTNDRQLPAKTYKINFTSLPELLEHETMSLPVMQDDKIEDERGENKDVQKDNNVVDSNVLRRSNSHYKIHPKTPKPPTSGEIQHKSIKSLKAVKFQTHAHVEWYVTAQSILRNAAINKVRPVKQFTEKDIHQSTPLITKNGNDVDNKKRNIIALRNIPISDTKLHDAHKNLILDAADINKVIDDSSKGSSQAKEPFDQRVAIDLYNNKRDRKNSVTISHSANSIRERNNNGRTPLPILDKQPKGHNNISINITSTGQTPKGPYKTPSLIKHDGSAPIDTELHYKVIQQPNGLPVNIHEKVGSQIEQPSAFSFERTYDVRIKTNASTEFSNSADALYQSEVDSFGSSSVKTAPVRPVDVRQGVDTLHNTRHTLDKGQAQQGLQRTFVNNTALDIPTTSKSDFTQVPDTKSMSNITTDTRELFTQSVNIDNRSKTGTQSNHEAANRIPDDVSKDEATSAPNIYGFSRGKHKDKNTVLSDISQEHVRDNEEQSHLSLEQIHSNRDTKQKYNKTLLDKQTMVEEKSRHEKMSIISKINDSKKASTKIFKDQLNETNSNSSIQNKDITKIRTSYEDIKPWERAHKQTKKPYSEQKPMKNDASATYNFKIANDTSITATLIVSSNTSENEQGTKTPDLKREKTHIGSYVTDIKYRNINSNDKSPDNKLSKPNDHLVYANKNKPNMKEENMNKYVPDKSAAANNSLLKTYNSNQKIVNIVALQDVKQPIQGANVHGFIDKKENTFIKEKHNGPLYDSAENQVNGKYNPPVVLQNGDQISVVHSNKLDFSKKSIINHDPSNVNVRDTAGKTSAIVNKSKHVSGTSNHMVLQKNPQMQATLKTSNLANSTKNVFTKDVVSSKTYKEKTSGEVAISQSNSTKRPSFNNVTMSAKRMDVTNTKKQPSTSSKSPPERYTTANSTKVTIETQLSATRNETIQDPFELMSLFMAKHNLLEAILKVERKQPTTVRNLASKTLPSTSTPVLNSSILPIKITPVKVAVTGKTSSSQVMSTSRSPPKDVPTRNITNGNARISVNSTLLKAVVSVKVTTKGSVEEKQKPKSTAEPEIKTHRTTELIKTTYKPSSTASLTSTSTTKIHMFPSTDKNTRSATTKRLAEGTNTTSVHTSVKPTKLSVTANTTQLPSTFSPRGVSVSVKAKNLNNGTAGIQHPDLKTTSALNQINTNQKYREQARTKLPVLAPDFDQNGTKIVYSPGRPNADEDPISKTLFTPMYIAPASMNTLPEHGFILHTQSLKDGAVKSNKQQPDGLPLPKLSRTENGVRRQSIYREMNLDKFRSYVNAIRNYPTVKVPYQGLYRPDAEKNSALNGVEVAELPQPGRRYGAFYSSVSNVGVVFTRYWPAVLGVSVGTIFLVTALVTSILCRQRRLLIQRARWSDSPQHVSEPPDTSEYTSSSEASLASDLTRSSIHLM